ncbi:hypothetical protein DPMN_042485 [Dreissena polymorpha]|uniref:Uncharacterized protein n=1 Tax=Dreissena polymorpha TaxID=45954 RepID=A0A9D4HWY5_DREPO|nr:hypothetical protein DPMN_042485 [Dreissena polymorpha]
MNRQQTGCSNGIRTGSLFAPLKSKNFQEEMHKSRNDKRKRQESADGVLAFRHSSSADSSPIKQMYSTDNLQHLESKIYTILDGMKNMGLLKCRVDNIESSLYSKCAAQNITHERVLLLEYKTLELEARQRESFILIAGVDECENENCFNTVHEFLRRSFNIDRDEISVLCANRVGRRTSTNNT